MDDEETENDALNALLKAKCDELMMRFDTVQIVCTTYDAGKDETMTYGWGKGNMHAREGSARYFLKREDVRDRERLASNESEDDEELI